MATVGISLSNVCAGGGHATVNASVDGGATRTYIFDTDELLAPLDTDETRAAVKAIIRLREKGKARALARTDLQAGFTVTV
jgi:hypothetical protein